MRGVLLLMVLCLGCRTPDYFEVSPGYGVGVSTFPGRPFNSFGTEEYALVLTIGWSLGTRHEAERNLALLRPSLDLSPHHVDTVPLTVNVQPASLQEPSGDAKPDPTLLDKIKRGPESVEEGLLTFMGICLAGLGVALAVRFKLLSRLMGKKPD